MPFLFPEGTPRLFRILVSYGIPDTDSPFHSVHYYLANNDFGNAADLAEQFAPDYRDVFEAIVCEVIVSFGVIVTNLGSTTDTYTLGQSCTGAWGGDLLDPWSCWVFREATGNRLAPYGYKRIGYLTESMVNSGGGATSAIVDNLGDYADFLVATVSTGSVVYTPVLTSEANESHDDDLVLPFNSAVYQKKGHATGRKSY